MLVYLSKSERAECVCTNSDGLWSLIDVHVDGGAGGARGDDQRCVLQVHLHLDVLGRGTIMVAHLDLESETERESQIQKDPSIGFTWTGAHSVKGPTHSNDQPHTHIHSNLQSVNQSIYGACVWTQGGICVFFVTEEKK